MRNREAVSKWQ